MPTTVEEVDELSLEELRALVGPLDPPPIEPD
jgi:hypothetical protein